MMTQRSYCAAGVSLPVFLAVIGPEHRLSCPSGVGRASLPFALDRKYPNAGMDWGWQFVFPAARVCRDARWGPPSRFHLHESAVQRGVADAVRRAGNGQRGIDFSSAQFQAKIREAIAKGEAGRPVPKAEAFKILDPKNAAWVQTRMTAQPTGVATQPIALIGARERIAKKTYIRAPLYPQPTFDAALAKCKADPTWKTFELPASESGHDVMVDAPERLVEILQQVA
jgi:hypothetical protein